MSGVTINNITSDSVGLVMTSFDIGLPNPKRTTISIQGRDGVLDVTSNLFSKTYYENRTIKIDFATSDEKSGKAWAELFSYCANQWHGKNVTVIFDDDAGNCWNGYCTVSSNKATGGKRTISLSIDADPYKTNLTDSSKSL